MKIFFCTALLFTLISAVNGQRIINNPSQEDTVFVPNVTVIPDREWKMMTDYLNAEDWDRASFYASGLMRRLRTDNDKKQVARLRYFYLFSLAGRILKAHDAGKKADLEAAWLELDKAVEESIGKEFILPAREYRSDCNKNLNVICPVINNEKAVRTAATNKNTTAIHSFDYVIFDRRIDFLINADKQFFLGGNLKKVEFNEDLSEPWVMYLVFEKGFVRVVAE